MLMIDEEKRHEIRYHVQQYFIPEMVECVKDGYLPFIALFPSAQWLSNLRMDYELEDLKAAKVWDSFEKIPVDEDTMIVLYTFPKPEDVPEAAYGAVLLRKLGLEPAQGAHPDGNFKGFFLLGIFKEFLCLFGLLKEGADALLQ